MTGQLRHELLDRAARQLRRYQAFHFHVLELQRQAHLAPQDDELACHVHARQVIARIRLGKAALARVLHDLGEAHPAVVDVEQVGERAGEDALDAGDVITGLAQVPERVHDREPRADGGLVQVMGRARAPRLVQAMVVGEIGAVGLLVRRHDVNTGREPVGVAAGDRGARRAVNQHRMWQVVDAHVLDEARHIRPRAALLVARAPVAERHPRVREQHALRAEHAANAQIEFALPAQPLALRGELIEQHPADGPRTDHADRNRVRRQIQARMHCAQRARGAASLDHGGDVALGGALGDGAHVDAGGPQRREHLGGDARCAGHAIADDGQNRQIRIDVDALDLALLQLALEGAAHHTCRALGLLLGDRAADGVLGTALRNEDDRNALLAQRAEQPVSGAGYADHPGAFQVDERDAFDAGDALDGQRRRGPGADQGAHLGGRKRVADPDRDAVLDGRRHGLRVKHLGAEVRQLHRLAVRERVDDRGVRHATRVGRQHAIDVGPDVDLGRAQQRSEDGGGEIAAIASEGRLHAALVGGDEPGDDQGAAECGRDQRLEVGA